MIEAFSLTDVIQPARKFLALFLCLQMGFGSLARGDEPKLGLSAPLVRGPGITQEQIEAIAEAHGRPTLSEEIDIARPGAEWTTRLHKLVERAQTSWLTGSIENSRAIFKEIVRLELEADWRPTQREAIQYAFLRLAQSSPTPTEKSDWLERAITTFPDLEIDEDAFPPPLTDAFRTTRARLMALASTYSPYEHFPDLHYLLINGKRFVVTPDLKIRLPKGTFRITALSDLFAPMTERLTSAQMEMFRLSLPPIATGSCSSPQDLNAVRGFSDIAVVFSADCVRTHTPEGWTNASSEFSVPSANKDLASSLGRIDRNLVNGASTSTADAMAAHPDLPSDFKDDSGQNIATQAVEPKGQPSLSPTLILIGLSVIAIGIVLVMQNQVEMSAVTTPSFNPALKAGL